MSRRPGGRRIKVAEASKSQAKRAGFRTDIQALRAVAIGLVVLNHLWPSRLTGGYVGVDVFFVISGYLISSHLTREIESTGRVRLGRFYARRVRRLLPAAFLVLGFVIVTAYFLLPYSRWEENAHEAFASATYWENWLLAAKSVDYSQFNAAASLTQHYWSLSVEEQFYLFWPLLLWVTYRYVSPRLRIPAVTVVCLASLAFSVYFTSVAKSQAYFITPVRIWEFAIGALVGLLGARLLTLKPLANVMSLVGMAAVVASAVLFTDQTEFPGVIAAIPAVGTALVIAAGVAAPRQWHTPLSSWAPVQFLGDISYSLYLWHWPFIILTPFAFPSELKAGSLTLPLRIIILVVSIVVAALSKKLIEDRGLTWPLLVRSTGWTFTAMTAGITALAVAAGTLIWTYNRHVDHAEMVLLAQRGGACHAAEALRPRSKCADPFGPATNTVMGPANAYYNLPKDCPTLKTFPYFDGTPSVVRCDYSAGAAHPTIAWLVGDSHAKQWQAPMFEIARKNHWILYFSSGAGCPFAKVTFVNYRGLTTPSYARMCMKWAEQMTPAIAATRPKYVFTTLFARDEQVDDHSGRSQLEQYRAGLTPFWKTWHDAGAQVVVIGDPPENVDVRKLDCVVLNPTNPTACAAPRSLAQPPDPLIEVARTSRDLKVKVVDLTNYFCDQRLCYAVIGKVPVYFDDTHMNLEYALSLEPMLASAIGVSAGP